MADDDRSLAERIGVPEGTMLEWSPIVSRLKDIHTKPRPEPLYIEFQKKMSKQNPHSLFNISQTHSFMTYSALLKLT